MAPEQAEGDSSRVGPAADVYALGAILYEMLTGRPPFSAASTLETLDLVRRAEPAPPRRVRRDVPRDLETIALKCLEKSPDRRYISAKALADDLRRHLDGEPILARPISRPERLAKWARRRPWQAVSAALAALATIGLVVGTLVHNAQLRAEVTRTEQQADEARRQRERADAQYRSARDAVARMAHRFNDPRFAGLTIPVEFRRQIIEDALEFYEGAVRDDAPASLAERIDKAHALKEAATLQTMLGRQGDAERTLRRSLALIDALPAGDAARPIALDSRVEGLVKLGLMISNDAKRTDEAIASVTLAIEAAERLARDDPSSIHLVDTLARSHHNLGSVLLNGGRAGEAEPHFLRAAEIREALVKKFPAQEYLPARLAETLINLGLAHSTPQQAGRADAEFARAAELLGPAVHDRPDVDSLGLSLAKLYKNWGNLALVEHRPDLAIERYRLGLGELDPIDRSMPDWPHARQIRLLLSVATAQAHEQAGRFADAAPQWALAADLSGAAERPYFRLARAASLARAGDGPAALAEAEAIATGDRLSSVDLYNLACVATLASAQASRSGSPDRAAASATKALAWLGAARGLGLFRDPAMLRTLDDDTDLDVLRPRRDFQLLRLDAAFPADPFAGLSFPAPLVTAGGSRPAPAALREVGWL